MKIWEYTSEGLEDTLALGEKLGKNAQPSMLFLLDGDLGAGKTTFTKGIARGLGIKRNVTSPTFTILKVYKEGRMPLYHIDAYRLEGLHQDLGFDELMNDEGLTVIEWSEFLADLDRNEYLNVSITLLEDEARRFHFEARGTEYEKLLEEIA